VETNVSAREVSQCEITNNQVGCFFVAEVWSYIVRGRMYGERCNKLLHTLAGINDRKVQTVT